MGKLLYNEVIAFTAKNRVKEVIPSDNVKLTSSDIHTYT